MYQNDFGKLNMTEKKYISSIPIWNPDAAGSFLPVEERTPFLLGIYLVQDRSLYIRCLGKQLRPQNLSGKTTLSSLHASISWSEGKPCLLLARPLASLSPTVTAWPAKSVLEPIWTNYIVPVIPVCSSPERSHDGIQAISQYGFVYPLLQPHPCHLPNS